MDDWDRAYREKEREWERAEAAKGHEQLVRARRDVLLMLDGKLPQEGEDYGYWKRHLERLRQTFEQKTWGDAKGQLAMMLYEGKQRDVRRLLEGAVDGDGQLWIVKVSELLAGAKKYAAELRMKERLARTTGDSMADEIMGMLRERELSRTDIYRRYSRNVTAEQVNDALFVLERLGWARWKTVSTGGRKRELWFLPPEE